MKSNILIDPLPETVMVNGREFSINTDFRVGILFEMLMDDSSVSKKEKIFSALSLYYTEEIPQDIEKAVDAIITFYRCGRTDDTRKKSHQKKEKSLKKLIYSFEHDDSYIFAAFFDQYSLDLNEINNLHWWKFMALFRGLKSDNEIVKIMGYRSTDVSKIKNKEERQRIIHLQNVYALPSTKSFEEKVSTAGAIFGGGFA